MNVFEIIGAILMIITSVLIVIMVMFQNPKGDALSSLAGGSESFLGKSGDRSLDATLNRFIKIACIVFCVLTIAVYAFGVYL